MPKQTTFQRLRRAIATNTDTVSTVSCPHLYAILGPEPERFTVVGRTCSDGVRRRFVQIELSEPQLRALWNQATAWECRLAGDDP